VNAKQDLSRELTKQGLVQKARDEFRAPYLMEGFHRHPGPSGSREMFTSSDQAFVSKLEK